MQDADPQPLVSIIVPTFNSESTLERTLQSLRDQTYGNIEIIIVDKASKDGTEKITRRFTSNYYSINSKERCEQINFGIKKANGVFVYRVDSDFILEPDVVKEAIAVCLKNGLDGVVIHNTSDDTISFWSKVRRLERDCYLGSELNVAARFVKKDAIMSIGLFDEELVASEDYDLHNRLLAAGYKIGRTTESKEVHVGEPRTLKEIITKHYYYGKTIRAFLAKNQKRGASQLNPIRASFFKHWREFAKRPKLTCGFIIYQVARYYSAGAGYIASYFTTLP